MSETKAEQRLRILIAGHPGCSTWRRAVGTRDECGNCGASRAAHEIFQAMSAGADALRLWREYLEARYSTDASPLELFELESAARALLTRAQE